MYQEFIAKNNLQFQHIVNQISQINNKLKVHIIQSQIHPDQLSILAKTPVQILKLKHNKVNNLKIILNLKQNHQLIHP